VLRADGCVEHAQHQHADVVMAHGIDAAHCICGGVEGEGGGHQQR
jgi:hypothetical protein